MSSTQSQYRLAILASMAVLRRLTPLLNEARGADMRLLPMPVEGPQSGWLQRLQSLRPDALLLEFDPDRVEASLALRLPTLVLLGEVLSDQISCVTVDEAAIGRHAAGYLEQRGLPYCSWIEPLHSIDPGRREAYAAALGSRMVHGFSDSSTASAYNYLEKPGAKLLNWLRHLPLPIGIFATEEALGWKLIEAARMLNLRIPEDLSILTVGKDEAICEWAQPGLSTVDLPWKALLRAGIDILRGRLSNTRQLIPEIRRLPPQGITTRASSDFSGAGNALVEEALAFIRSHPARALQVADLIAALATNRRSLERAFRATLGKSPKQVLAQVRLQSAVALLQKSQLPITRVAEQSGFPCAEIFSRDFRKAYSCSPRQWRAAHQD